MKIMSRRGELIGALEGGRKLDFVYGLLVFCFRVLGEAWEGGVGELVAG